MPNVPVLVLDSFALLAFFQDEPAARTVANLLRRAQRGEVRLAMTVTNMGEVVYRTIREHGFERAQEVVARLEEYDIDIVDVDRELALDAAQLKGSHQMAYADCLAAALARRLDGAVLTGDQEFRQVEGLVAVEWLTGGGS